MAEVGGVGPASGGASAAAPGGGDFSGAIGSSAASSGGAAAVGGGASSAAAQTAQGLRSTDAAPFAAPEPIGLLPDRAPNGAAGTPGLGSRVSGRVAGNFSDAFSTPLGPGQAYRDLVDPFVRPSGDRFTDALTAPFRGFNEALMLGAPAALDGLGRTVGATYYSLVDGGTETLKSLGMSDGSAEMLGRDLKAMPEAFGGSPTMFARGGAVARPATTAMRQSGAGWVAGAADEAYDAIRASRTDVAQIAANTGLKPSNVQKVKDHLFMNEHVLDRYVDLGVPATIGRFDSDAAIAAAWKRLEAGSFTQSDMQLLRHETAEAWRMRNVAPGYDAAHTAAQRRFPAPEY